MKGSSGFKDNYKKDFHRTWYATNYCKIWKMLNLLIKDQLTKIEAKVEL